MDSFLADSSSCQIRSSAAASLILVCLLLGLWQQLCCRVGNKLWQAEGSFQIQAASTAVGLQLSPTSLKGKAGELDLIYKLAVKVVKKQKSTHLYAVLVM